MTASSTFCFPTTIIKLSESSDRRACWLGIFSGFMIKFGKSKRRSQTSEGASAVWSLLFSTIARNDMSMLWLDTAPIWWCKGGLAGAVTVFIAAQFDCTVALSQTAAGLNVPCMKLCRVLPYCSFKSNIKYLNGYLDPRLQRQPYEPSWPGFPRSPVSTPHSTAGATGPWKKITTDFRGKKKQIQICSLPCLQWWHQLIRNWFQLSSGSAVDQVIRGGMQ